MNITNAPPLFQAVAANQVETIKEIINKSPNLIKDTWCYSTPMHVAASYGYADVIRTLHNFDDNMMYICGAYDKCTAMHIAAIWGHVNVIKLLMELDDQIINIVNNNGDTPLHMAVTNNRVNVTTMLCEYGADLDITNNYGRTPLHIAAGNKDVDMVTMLVGYGANPDLQDKFGETAMHYALKNQYDENNEKGPRIIEILLINGSQASKIKNTLGYTAFEEIWYRWSFLAVERTLLFDSEVMIGNKLSHLIQYSLVKSSRLVSVISLFGTMDEYKQKCAIYGKIPFDITEDELLEPRWRAYFSRSLLYRLLYVK
jgi:ankyrin repeat protein